MMTLYQDLYYYLGRLIRITLTFKSTEYNPRVLCAGFEFLDKIYHAVDMLHRNPDKNVPSYYLLFRFALKEIVEFEEITMPCGTYPYIEQLKQLIEIAIIESQ